VPAAAQLAVFVPLGHRGTVIGGRCRATARNRRVRHLTQRDQPREIVGARIAADLHGCLIISLVVRFAP
jgi:hypothetical protein